MSERFHVRTIPEAALASARDAAIAELRAALPPWAEVLEVGSTAVAGVQ